MISREIRGFLAAGKGQRPLHGVVEVRQRRPDGYTGTKEIRPQKFGERGRGLVVPAGVAP